MPLLRVDCNGFSNLKLHVYTVGYPVQGESILIIVEQEGVVILSVVTDCYSDNGYNHVEQILSEWRASKIDLFIWTHPDKDHSVGIEHLLQAFDPERDCHIFVPRNLNYALNSHNVAECSESAHRFINTNYNIGRRKRGGKFGFYHSVGYDCCADPTVYHIYLEDLNTCNIMTLDLEIYGPVDQEALQVAEEIGRLKANPMSVIYRLNANGVNLLMTGDMNEWGCGALPESATEMVHFLKIPHHGSAEPKSFPKRMIQNRVEESVGVTTEFKWGRSDLPDSNMVGQYKKCIKELYFTGGADGHCYGAVHLRYDLRNVCRVGSVECLGNAVQL